MLKCFFLVSVVLFIFLLYLLAFARLCCSKNNVNISNVRGFNNQGWFPAHSIHVLWIGFGACLCVSFFSGIQDKAAALPGDAGASGKTAVVQVHDTPSCCCSHIEQATFYIPLAEASHMVKLPKIRWEIYFSPRKGYSLEP